MHVETLSLRAARRLALTRAGLLAPETTGLPRFARGHGPTAFAAAHTVVRRFGYLQLDTVSIAGARSHAIVLLSRLEGLDAAVGEELLGPGRPVFEYWGHEASWIPLELYPAFEFRRREFRHHPWWGDVLGAHPEVARELRKRIREGGPLRSIEMEGRASRGWWDLSVAKRVAASLWSSGELAIRERRGFQRTYDLTERVIPEELRKRPLKTAEALDVLLLKALDGHGWATAGTLAATWRLRNRKRDLVAAFHRLREKREIVPCAVESRDAAPQKGWIRPADLELAARLEGPRPRGDRGVLLSPFDPLLWDRRRVACFFGFDALLEIFKPAPQRRLLLPARARGRATRRPRRPQGRAREGPPARARDPLRGRAGGRRRARPRGDPRRARSLRGRAGTGSRALSAVPARAGPGACPAGGNRIAVPEPSDTPFSPPRSSRERRSPPCPRCGRCRSP